MQAMPNGLREVESGAGEVTEGACGHDGVKARAPAVAMPGILP